MYIYIIIYIAKLGIPDDLRKGSISASSCFSPSLIFGLAKIASILCRSRDARYPPEQSSDSQEKVGF